MNRYDKIAERGIGSLYGMLFGALLVFALMTMWGCSGVGDTTSFWSPSTGNLIHDTRITSIWEPGSMGTVFVRGTASRGMNGTRSVKLKADFMWRLGSDWAGHPRSLVAVTPGGRDKLPVSAPIDQIDSYSRNVYTEPLLPELLQRLSEAPECHFYVEAGSYDVYVGSLREEGREILRQAILWQKKEISEFP